ncbi:PLP-dependent aminotransferase family protein [Streptomyces sp. NPDC006186]|uniref:aminotransferase-like domain-containing protein n=1 Tax=Streptomyces sp. NPDC006186 TaxID=3155248 RepID=UPI0033BE93CB
MSTRSRSAGAPGRTRVRGDDAVPAGPEPEGHGSDFLQLDVRDVPADGKADWLAGELRRAIADGRVAVGSRLPPTRVLAAELRLSRGVVTEAYRRLAEDGQVEGRRRGGTVVVAAPFAPASRGVPGAGRPARGAGTTLPGGGPTPSAAAVPAPSTPPPAASSAPTASSPPTASSSPTVSSPPAASSPPADLADPGRRPSPATPFSPAPGPAVFDELRAAPAAVDLTPGRPDLAAFPRAAWLRAERAVLGGLSAEQLGYGDPRGVPELRRAVAGWVARNRGVRVAPDEVLIVSGTAQALTLLHPVLRAEGVDAVAVEDPGSLGSRQHLQAGGLATPGVPVDEDGVRVDALRATGARAVLLTPAHQFPTGVVLSGERRRELLAWARDGGLILEDDYDAEHRYDRPPVPALRGLLADRVCYLGSVSKLLAPALRIGWMVPPPRHRGALTDAKRFADLGNPVLPQLVLARLMDSGELERHLRTLRRRHRARRDAMIAALAVHLPGAVVHGASAGLHLTVTYEADVPDLELAGAALARGVKCQPLSWHRQRPGPPGLVLGYASSPPGVIAEGVAVLGEALRELCR